MAWVRCCGGGLPARPIALAELLGTYSYTSSPIIKVSDIVGPISATDKLKISFTPSPYWSYYAIELSIDNGVTWNEVYNERIGTSTPVTTDISLVPYNGYNVKVRFKFTSEHSGRQCTVTSALIE